MASHIYARICAFLVAIALFAGLAVTPALAQASPNADVQTTWRLLDYLAVDYGEAVSKVGGKVVNPAEYNEMQEFSATAAEKLRTLSDKPGKAGLIAQAAKLQEAIDRKAPPAEVASIARGLGQALLAAYPVAMAPSATPDLGRGVKLYREHCASCHGANGAADTAIARQLDPPPVDFTDRLRASERSPFALYQVIDQGLEGTAMAGFSSLPEEDKWALAFHSSRLAYPEALAEQGEQLWNSDPGLRALLPNLESLSGLSERALAEQLDPAKAAALIAYFRTHPEALAADSATSLDFARQKLRESLEAYRAGDRDKAKALALSAYLDGFEPVEPVLATRDGELMRQVERAMSGFRVSIASNRPEAALRQQLADTEHLLDRAEAALAPEAATEISTFLGAFTILLREGLEALLVVIAMIAFLRKAERVEALPYVHGGWIAALVAGAATWAIATYAIGISGASRELTEGFGSLLAALILLSVGVWMHGKSQADEWRRYIREKLQHALSRGSAWFLFGLAFLVVYREVFETILFYAALWTPDNGMTVLAGALSAIVLLAIIAWAMLRYSRTLPIGAFFKYSAILIAVLAVVLAGKGVGALQEAGLIPITPLGGVPRITVLGLFPTLEAVAAQLLMLAALVIGFRSAVRRPAHPLPAE
jgi:high-affinity iron transporter